MTENDTTNADYRIWCPHCDEEEFLDGDTPLNTLSQARKDLCPCDATYQEVLETGRKEAMQEWESTAMTNEQVRVTIDSREPDGVVGSFASHQDVSHTEQHELEKGDIHIGDVIIERKTPSDLASSIVDNRLFSQSRAMAEDGLAFILLEGELYDFDALSHSSIPSAAVIGAIASVTIRAGVPVIPCGDRIELVDLAVRLGRKSIESDSTAFSQDGFDNDGNVNPTIQMYTAIPGIGPGRAETLYEHYPTIVDLCSASETDLREIEGMGPKSAEAIISTLSGGRGGSVGEFRGST